MLLGLCSADPSLSGEVSSRVGFTTGTDKLISHTHIKFIAMAAPCFPPAVRDFSAGELCVTWHQLLRPIRVWVSIHSLELNHSKGPSKPYIHVVQLSWLPNPLAVFYTQRPTQSDTVTLEMCNVSKENIFFCMCVLDVQCNSPSVDMLSWRPVSLRNGSPLSCRWAVGIGCTAGVMLSIKRSDRNANQVSKLTLHSHRCTSDFQWFISQSESVSVLWVSPG